MKSERQEAFRQILEGFPPQARKVLELLPQTQGCLNAGQCLELCRILDLSLYGLMVQLLPLARAYALPPVSQFHVGAVALAAKNSDPGSMGVYLGGNMEFPGVALNLTIHAEQCASMNAWHRGARQLSAIAVTDSPCGYCRQFMKEWMGEEDIRIITAAKGGRAREQRALPGLLPTAFGPADLGKQEGLGMPPALDRPLLLAKGEPDELTAQALEAASKSYAPYSGNLAGAAALLHDGRIIKSSYVESAAFNPSLSPMQTLAIRLNLAGVLDYARALKRLVLVEQPAPICQLGAARVLARAWAPDIELEYHLTQKPEKMEVT